MNSSRTLVVTAISCLLSVALGHAQGGGSGSGSQPSSPSTPSASQGSATIENEIIAYKVLGMQAGQIADRVLKSCVPPGCVSVLLTDPNSQSEIVTAKGFEASALALGKAYDGIEPAIPRAEAASDVLSASASLLTAIRSVVTYSNQTFQPTTQSMINLLSKELHTRGIALWTSAQPGNLDAGFENVKAKLSDIAQKRKDAYTRAQNEGDKDKKAAALAALGDTDKEFSAFRTSLTGTSPDGTVLATIVKGETLQVSLGKTGLLLTVSVDAAGGDTKVTHWFLVDLFIPTPSPSYSGGGIVSFLLADQAGVYKDADMFHAMYGFSKWKSPKYTDK